ncbi:GTP-binding protein [Paenibacillus sp. YN15]|uniref:CobW family GTP-binding protein n=1 Tax=Paenibacillus sp. YN15 TaxID=1742774 RepID=UPI000DCE6E86|nr:GTP-binding protein [Paenibacillus sp. YN15]RAV05572.1 GTP-binding protein [Paenibacillus sp. YN15]
MKEQAGAGVKQVPIIVLSGFLGSGKTTLLLRILEDMKQRGLTPAVLMNEIGEVSLDGVQMPGDVPMAEIMDGCICCSVRGELSASVKLLVEQYDPDGIIVEATGLAHPSEIVEALTDTSLVLNTELRSVVTVVAADFFVAMTGGEEAGASPETLALLLDQVNASDTLILNRTDLLEAGALRQAEEQLAQWNRRARIFTAQYSRVDVGALLGFDEGDSGAGNTGSGTRRHTAEGREESQSIPSAEEGPPPGKPLHDHVTVFTRRLRGPVNEAKFMRFIAALSSQVYRAKGIVTFEGESKQQLFQYAFREISFVDIQSTRKLDDVLVLMGEGISRTKMQEMVNQLEGLLPPAVRAAARPAGGKQKAARRPSSLSGN